MFWQVNKNVSLLSHDTIKLEPVLRNLRKNWKEIQVKVVVTYNATKLSFFTKMEDPILELASFFLFIILVAKDVTTITLVKQRPLFEKINEHGYLNKDSCKDVNSSADWLNINNISAECEKFDRKSFGVNIVKKKYHCIIDCIIDKVAHLLFILILNTKMNPA